ncbi:MAG: SAM-dependent methyltransferase, partial [Pseudomonadota bacterium]|nr:SAM-dependent methyltransferase [Pseudomonadota bacterium]
MSASGTLTIVATPIGNLGDFTPRAAAALAGADVIACEDTRTTRKLLRLTGNASTASMVPYHDHNGAEMRPWLLEQLEAGRKVALVSDAGTPLVSDPGYKLVAACRDAGITVVAVPGASAVLAA